MTQEKHNVRIPLNERMAALRQLPPVLKLVWQAGPTVVFLGIVFRIITALLPIGLLAISKLIIDNIVGVVAHHRPVPTVLWWLVELNSRSPRAAVCSRECLIISTLYWRTSTHVTSALR